MSMDHLSAFVYYEMCPSPETAWPEYCENFHCDVEQTLYKSKELVLAKVLWLRKRNLHAYTEKIYNPVRINQGPFYEECDPT